MENSSRLTTAFFVFLIVCLFDLPAYGALYSGGGTEADPYIISTAAEMNDIGNNPAHFGSYFLLTVDIDLGAYTGTSFNIIGNGTTEFTGVFDGNDHTISNFTYDSNWIDYIGLFGYVDDPNAEIKNLGLIDPSVNAGTGDRVGSLVGQLQRGSVTDCNSVGGSVSGNYSVGGLVGWAGLPGLYELSTVSNSYATGSVSGKYYVGGLVGYNQAVVSNCYAMASVSGDLSVGGIVGLNVYGTVSNCYAMGGVSGNDRVGGLVGSTRFGTVSNSYAAGSVSGDNIVGGLVGGNDGTVSNSYATGSVSGNYGVGGLIGYDDTGDYTKCFWDSTVNPDVNGIGNGADANVIGESTVNMQTESTFTDAGWNFVEVWNIGENQTYPYLRVYPVGDLNHDFRVDFFDFAILADHWLAGVE